MNNTDYQHYFKSVLNMVHPIAPYNEPDYMNYCRLNWFRQQRWLKNGILNNELVSLLNDIDEPQKWIYITEPWCADAAHTLPFTLKLAEGNPFISLDIQLRDSPPFTIEKYLTGNSRSIPKLIIRDADERELFVWGSRPEQCQRLYERLKIKETQYGQRHIEIQNWYNKDAGRSFQLEILKTMRTVLADSLLK
ncbi:thioredoxin family protein [Mucilaginibacter lutimaris]|uniref:Thioredoxin family protein n=1 Tax=Mucilaginibacter lutimaris TaxID=931629 RepID=A0ABW2ZEK1_9SPHI